MRAGQTQLHAAIAAFEGQRARRGDTNVDMALTPMRAKLAGLGATVRSTGLRRAVGWTLLSRVSPWRTSRKAVGPRDARQAQIVRTRAPLLGLLNDRDVCQESESAPDRVMLLGRAR